MSRKFLSAAMWVVIALVGAAGFAVVALNRGETVSAVWVLAAALGTFAIAYRFYARFIVERVLGVDPARMTPAVRHDDGLDYVPTHRVVLFGHHFAAIAGAGPLIGPVLAAQMGYLPGMLWLIAGVVLAGAVQDCVILFLSTRRDGRSLGDMIRAEIGPFAGTVASVGILAIMVILLAVIALIVVKALVGSPWGTFTVALTIPIALFMGAYVRWIRPGRVLEISLIGAVLLVFAVYFGGRVAENPELAAWFTFKGATMAWLLIGYGFAASVLPVWLLLAPRDYLSTFMKIGTVALLAVTIVLVMPELRMPAVTRFVDGTGPVWSGALFPFLFITIACGAVSGFHALISSGTTPKMLQSEGDIRMLGYGGMLTESFVGVMALIAATTLDPGVYFALNSPSAVIGGTVETAAAAISQWGFVITPADLEQTARSIGEQTILSRTGGAPTLAVGMAQMLSQLFGAHMLAFWYHYAILFEALFILTTLDAGTRVGRFMIQDLLGQTIPALGRTRSLGANMFATLLCVSAWGWFLYQGVIDPFGGINRLWPLFGIANQMLAGIALTLASVALVKMKRTAFLPVTLVPTLWLLACTSTAAWIKIFDADPRLGFLAHARKLGESVAQGQILAPAKSIAEMQSVITNDYVNAAMAGMFLLVMVTVFLAGARAALAAHRTPYATAHETPAVAVGA